MTVVERVSGTKTAVLGEKLRLSTLFSLIQGHQHSTGGLPEYGCVQIERVSPGFNNDVSASSGDCARNAHRIAVGQHTKRLTVPEFLIESAVKVKSQFEAKNEP